MNICGIILESFCFLFFCSAFFLCNENFAMNSPLNFKEHKRNIKLSCIIQLKAMDGWFRCFAGADGKLQYKKLSHLTLRIKLEVLEKWFFIVIMWKLRIRYLLTCESEIKDRNCSLFFFSFQDFPHHRFIFIFSSFVF